VSSFSWMPNLERLLRASAAGRKMGA
jgi:hypothetical protein